MASAEIRKAQDHRVRIHASGRSGTHCLDCRQNLRSKGNAGPCTWRTDGD